MSLSDEPLEPNLDAPIVPELTKDALQAAHARAYADYESWKRDVVVWLETEGRDPERLRGYAESTVRQSNYKIDQLMRWLWQQRGYTTEFTPDDADAFMREHGRHGHSQDANLNTYVKTIKRLFTYYNREKGKSYEWECKLELNEPSVTNRDYFKQHEFRPLYEAALEHGTVKHYASCSPAERDELRAHLAQRFELPKEEVSKAEFARANSFKIPSLVSVSFDCGLRPVEIERSRRRWFHLDEAVLKIPKAESSKNEDNWECVLSNKSVRTLRQWLDERARYEEYEDTDSVWLNKGQNPYSSKSLNYLLTHLIEEAEIEPAGRDLSWYSIRHGVATVWANEENIQDAQEQLRHKKVETTLGYAHSGVGTRRNKVNSKW